MALSSGAALQKEEHGQTEQDLDHRGGRSAQTDLEEGGPRHAAHEIGYRDADEEGTYDTLDHDEQGLFTAIVVAGEAEEKGSEHAVDGISLAALALNYVAEFATDKCRFFAVPGGQEK